ncbi:MAG: SDR family NAD(P)-dependent oxidoreductase [Nitrososphaerales archaeon]
MIDQKVVLITGASSGFGRETAALLAQNSFRVFGTSRNESKESNFEFLKLDITNDSSVKDCVQSLLEKTNGRLDVLVNNAGFVLFGGIEEATIEEAKMQLDTNLFGAMRMIRSVLPAMRKQRSGQIINMGSLAGQIGVPFQGYYSTSKFALEGYTEVLRHEVRSLGIRVSIIEPGFFKTNIGRAAKSVSSKIEDYHLVREKAARRVRMDESRGQDPKIVAKLILDIINSKSPKLRYAIGKEKRALLYKRVLPASMFESGLRRHFSLD